MDQIAEFQDGIVIADVFDPSPLFSLRPNIPGLR